MKDLHVVKEIASLTRQELSDFIRENNQSFNEDWACACLVCSWVLNQILRQYGIKSDLCIGTYNGNDHAFAMVEDHVIDITATQFQRPEVVIEPFSGSRYAVEHKGQAARLKMKEWPGEQQPRTYKRKLGKIIKRLKQQGAGDHVEPGIGTREENEQ